MSRHALRFKGEHQRVWVPPKVVEIWESHRQVNSSSLEAFGIIIAQTSVNGCEVWLQAVTQPMAQDLRARHSFDLKDSGHQKAIEAEHKWSNGHSTYLGTWHTHPEPAPTPSTIDLGDWALCMKRNRDRSLIFAIVGTQETKMYTWGGQSFSQMEEIL